MKRIIYCTIICMLIFFSMSCKKPFNSDVFFKNIRRSDNHIDVQTGVSYSSFYDEEAFFDINEIISVKIDRIYSDKGKFNRDSLLIFKDGIIISEKTDSDSYSMVLYDYDEKERLTTLKFAPNGFVWTYTYPESNICEIWLNGEYFKTKVILSKKNWYSVVETDKNEDSTELIFYKEKGRLICVREKYSFLDSIREWVLEYVDGNLNKIVNQYIRDEKKDVRYVETVVSRDEKGNILKTETVNYRDGDISSTNIMVFSDYDIHGNWCKAESYIDKRLYYTTTRKFEYIDK